MLRKSSSLLVLAAMALCLPQFAHAKGSSTKIGIGYASPWPGAAAMGPSLRIAMPDLTIGFDAGWTTTSPATTDNGGAGTAASPKITTVPGSATMIQFAGRVSLPIKKDKAIEVYDAPGIGLEMADTGATTVTSVAGATTVTSVPGGSTTNFHVFNVLGFAYDLGFFGAPNVKLAIEGGLDLSFGKTGKFGFATSPFSVIGGAFHYYF